MKTRGPLTLATNIAAGHFMLCGMLGGVVLILSMGYGLSDVNHAPAWWFVLMDKVLLLLEAPVAVALRLLYHPSARFDPPAFFTVDIMDSSNFLVVVGLCAVWSLIVGYGAVWLADTVRKRM